MTVNAVVTPVSSRKKNRLPEKSAVVFRQAIRGATLELDENRTQQQKSAFFYAAVLPVAALDKELDFKPGHRNPAQDDSLIPKFR
ncbi:MAG: hypothetical protein M3209_11450 [Acidobacteriota bacterium]|nr:hypothetical protein [Acidobacteriota bacterium]